MLESHAMTSFQRSYLVSLLLSVRVLTIIIIISVNPVFSGVIKQKHINKN